MRTERHEVPGTFVTDVSLSGEGTGRVCLLLHGYSMNGAQMLRRCAPALPADWLVVAPNAPYPIPRKSEGRLELGYSWYFYDPSRDEYEIGMGPALDFAQGLLTGLGLRGRPVTVVGFSQGGYLAPFVAAKLPEVTHCVGIGCRFLESEIDLPLLRSRGVVFDGLHGTLDDMVSLEESRESHRLLAAAGIRGSFTSVSGSGHRMDDGLCDALRACLSSSPA